MKLNNQNRKIKVKAKQKIKVKHLKVKLKKKNKNLIIKNNFIKVLKINYFIKMMIKLGLKYKNKRMK